MQAARRASKVARLANVAEHATVPRRALRAARTRVQRAAGARRAVWEGRAQKTRGGLTRDDLKVSKSTGKIVSKRASRASKRSFERNGLRPDKNIAYKGAQYRGTKKPEEVKDAEDLDWQALLNDA